MEETLRYFFRASDVDDKFYWPVPFNMDNPITYNCMVYKVGDNYVAITADALNMSGEGNSKENALLDLKMIIEGAIKDGNGGVFPETSDISYQITSSLDLIKMWEEDSLIVHEKHFEIVVVSI
jgi:hypothetical protein